MPEHQNIEYKTSWRDEYLKWICGFANAQGGKIFIGMNDKGSVTGVEDYKKLMEEIPNKAVSHLGLVVDVNLHKKAGKYYIEINVPASTVPISYHGVHHYRSGSTKQELKGNALNHFILGKMGLNWEQKAVHEATMDDIDKDAVRSFVRKAVAKQRISPGAAKADILTILKNLKLVDKSNELSLAALLLFGKEPDRYIFNAYLKIGRFSDLPGDLRFQDIVKGNILEMADTVMEILNSKYLIRPISYQGLERMEPLEYPERALREMILNAIIHKDYADSPIFLRIYNDQLSIWNPGELIPPLTIDKLKIIHESKLRNPLIADIFFRAGYIESWGRGIDIMMEGCREYGMPEPLIEEDQGGIRVTFLKDIYTEEYLRSLDLNERQKKAIQYIRNSSQITNADYQKINNVSRRTALRDLQALINKQLIKRTGPSGSDVAYILTNAPIAP